MRRPCPIGTRVQSCFDHVWAQVLNTRAVEVMKRMSDKLMGRDYPTEGVAGGSGGSEPDSVYSQVQRLILAAISHENLCQSYIGWCAFW